MMWIEKLTLAKIALEKAEVAYLTAPNAYMKKARMREVEHFRKAYYKIIANQ